MSVLLVTNNNSFSSAKVRLFLKIASFFDFLAFENQKMTVSEVKQIDLRWFFLFRQFLIQLEQTSDDFSFRGILWKPVSLHDGGIVGAMGFQQLGEQE